MSLKPMLFCFVALYAIASPPPVLAQSPPSSIPPTQTVRLPDGSIYQGELVELVPGDHLTLRLASGEIKRFTWSEFQPASTPGTIVLPGLLGGSLLPAPLPPPAPEDLVNLHFQATDPEAVLFSSRATGNVRFNTPGANFDPFYQDWTMVCPRPPCDVRADRRQIYSIQGPWIVRSLPFTLPQGNLVTLDARVSRQSTRTFFTWMGVMGGAAAVTGMVLLTLGGAQDTTAYGGSDPTSILMQQDALNKQRTYYIAGGVLMGGGALLAIVGITAAVYTRTTINFSADGHVAMRLPGKAQLDLNPLQVRF